MDQPTKPRNDFVSWADSTAEEYLKIRQAPVQPTNKAPPMPVYTSIPAPDWPEGVSITQEDQSWPWTHPGQQRWITYYGTKKADETPAGKGEEEANTSN